MSVPIDTKSDTAEIAYRAAFDRLKRGAPVLLPKNTQVSQNNVAKEAGRDPSALRKSRYPTLVSEIRHWISDSSKHVTSQRQRNLRQQARKRSDKELVSAFKMQRDHAQALLIEAHATILEYANQIYDLRSQLEGVRPSAKLLPHLKR